MDHKEQHHQHHEKEREEKKKHHAQHEAEAQNQPRTIHPLWFVALGVVLVLLAVAAWTLVV